MTCLTIFILWNAVVLNVIVVGESRIILCMYFCYRYDGLSVRPERSCLFRIMRCLWCVVPLEKGIYVNYMYGFFTLILFTFILYIPQWFCLVFSHQILALHLLETLLTFSSIQWLTTPVIKKLWTAVLYKMTHNSHHEKLWASVWDSCGIIWSFVYFMCLQTNNYELIFGMQAELFN